jgi:sarcosine oxidase delta subunit
MTIQDIKNLDLYKCSLQDINKAEKGLYLYLRRNVKNHKTETYKEAHGLYTRVRRAQLGMTPDGYMMGYNTNMDRVPNSESVLK